MCASMTNRADALLLFEPSVHDRVVEQTVLFETCSSSDGAAAADYLIGGVK